MLKKQRPSWSTAEQGTDQIKIPKDKNWAQIKAIQIQICRDQTFCEEQKCFRKANNWGKNILSVMNYFGHVNHLFLIIFNWLILSKHKILIEIQGHRISSSCPCFFINKITVAAQFLPFNGVSVTSSPEKLHTLVSYTQWLKQSQISLQISATKTWRLLGGMTVSYCINPRSEL